MSKKQQAHYLPEKLEERIKLAIKQKEYDYSFDEGDRYINDNLVLSILEDFTLKLYEDTGKLTIADARKYLSISLSLFNKYKPEIRKTDVFKDMNIEGEWITHVEYFWNTYAYHFNDFKKVAERLYKSLNNGANNQPGSKSKIDIKLVSESSPETFEDLFDSDTQAYILRLLEDLKITHNGKSRLGERNKSAIRGIAEALLEEFIVPGPLGKLITIISNHIGLEVKSKLDPSTTSDIYRTKAIEYIKTHRNR